MGLLGIFRSSSVSAISWAPASPTATPGRLHSLQRSAKPRTSSSLQRRGQLVDRGEVEGALAIMACSKTTWASPSSSPISTPTIRSSTAPLSTCTRWATISYHVLDGIQPVTLTKPTSPERTVRSPPSSTARRVVAVPNPFPARASPATSTSTAATGPASTAASLWKRSLVTRHGAGPLRLVAELGVGAATHSTLQLALGVAACRRPRRGLHGHGCRLPVGLLQQERDERPRHHPRGAARRHIRPDGSDRLRQHLEPIRSTRQPRSAPLRRGPLGSFRDAFVHSGRPSPSQ